MIFSPWNHLLGGRSYPVRRYPIAWRLRDRGGSRLSMLATYPRSEELLGRCARSAIQGTPSPDEVLMTDAKN